MIFDFAARQPEQECSVLTSTQPLCNADRLALYLWKRAWSGQLRFFRVWSGRREGASNVTNLFKRNGPVAVSQFDAGAGLSARRGD